MTYGEEHDDIAHSAGGIAIKIRPYIVPCYISYALSTLRALRSI